MSTYNVPQYDPMSGLSNLNSAGQFLPQSGMEMMNQNGWQKFWTNPESVDGVGGGLNFDNIGALMKGLGSIGSLYGAFQQHKLAKDSLNFQKNAYNTNLKNETQTYNTSLEDRIRARYNTEGKSAASADQYIDENKL